MFGKTYFINYHTNYDFEIASIEMKAKKNMPELPKLVREGYNFKGWFLDKEFTQEYNLEQMPKANVDVYAKWEAITLEEFLKDINFFTKSSNILKNLQNDYEGVVDFKDPVSKEEKDVKKSKKKVVKKVTKKVSPVKKKVTSKSTNNTSKKEKNMESSNVEENSIKEESIQVNEELVSKEIKEQEQQVVPQNEQIQKEQIQEEQIHSEQIQEKIANETSNDETSNDELSFVQVASEANDNVSEKLVGAKEPLVDPDEETEDEEIFLNEDKG